MTENKRHNMLELAYVQKSQETLYCAGLDPHCFGGSGDMLKDFKANMVVYAFMNGGEADQRSEEFRLYRELTKLLCFETTTGIRFSEILASVETYIKFVVETLIREKDCKIYVFKPQAGFYEQFGPLGMIMLQRIRRHIEWYGKEVGVIVICILDCKRGDISTTQGAYFTGLLGNLAGWGIDHEPFGFDIINVTPWMGEDVLVLEEKGKPSTGLKLLRQGKGIIVVDKTSNPSGPQYQNLAIRDEDLVMSELVARDCYRLSQKYGLEEDGLSQIGLVVGSTHVCDGSLRRVFPTYVGLNPGFGAQKGEFKNVMLELIREGKWNGLGAIFTSSRGTMYPWEKKYGGSGKVENLRDDLITAIKRHREQEEEAYSLPEVIDAGIIYPFNEVMRTPE